MEVITAPAESTGLVVHHNKMQSMSLPTYKRYDLPSVNICKVLPIISHFQWLGEFRCIIIIWVLLHHVMQTCLSPVAKH